MNRSVITIPYKELDEIVKFSLLKLVMKIVLSHSSRAYAPRAQDITTSFSYYITK